MGFKTNITDSEMGKSNRIFIGFDYNDYFISLFDEKIKPWLIENSNEVTYPFKKTPGGDLIYRIFEMINNSNVTLFDCTTLNPNVLYELGYAIGRRLPFYILYNNDNNNKEELPQILKTQWGIWYDSFENIKSKLGFIKVKYFEVGIYDHDTNEILVKNLDDEPNINSIQIIIDSKNNYDEEVKIIKNKFKYSEINIFQIERYNNIKSLFDDINKETVIITILNPILKKNENAFSEVNTLNALKLFALGIAQAKSKTIFLFQRGNTNYSDVSDLSNHYINGNEFEELLNAMNKNILNKRWDSMNTGGRIGIPNLGKLINRNRITDFISSKLFEKKIFLRAPSGYGKSALGINISKEVNLPIVWYTIDKTIIDIIEIIKEIVLEFNKIDNCVGIGLNSILSEYGSNKITEDVFINYFLNEINLINNKVILIFDDVHHLNHDKCSLFIEKLVKYSFLNVGLILMSREELNINLEIKSKYIISIEKEEIEFNKVEINEYFLNNYRFSLSSNELDILMQKSEGWIASISLLQSIFAKSGKKAITEIIENLKGTNKKIYDYFAEIVYSNFDFEIQKILRHTSILRVINPSVFKYLFNISLSKSHEKLNELEKQNSFLFTFENEPDVYNYHSLFKDFLLKKYCEVEGKKIIEKNQFSVSNFYFDTNEYFDALNLGLECGNFSVVVKVIDKIGNHIVNENYGNLILNWISQIPPNYYDSNFQFYSIKGRSQESISDFMGAKLSYEKAKEILDTFTNKDKEKNRIAFFLMNLGLINIRKLNGEDQKLLEISKKAKIYKDEETYFQALGLFFQVKRVSFLTNPSPQKNLIEEAESLLKKIDSTLSELKISELNSKNLYLSQVLIDKAMVAHYIDWNKATDFLFMSKFSRVFEKEQETEIKKLSAFFENSQNYFKEALKLAEENKFQQITANILVNRAQVYDSTNVFYYFHFEFIDYNFFNQSIEDLNNALILYSSLKNNYNIAVVYNNLANTFLTNNDKFNRDKFASLAIEFAQKNDFKDIEEKSKEILKSSTIREIHLIKLKEVDDKMKNFTFTEKEKDDFANEFIKKLGNFSEEDFLHRKKIFLSEMDDGKMGKEIEKNWCKYFFVFHTNNPFIIHADIGQNIIKSYLNCDPIAQELHNFPREYFKNKSAKFIKCTKLGYSSNELSENVKKLSDEFIKTFCIGCEQRELN